MCLMEKRKKKRKNLCLWCERQTFQLRETFPVFKNESFYKKLTVIRHPKKKKKPSEEVFVPVQNAQMLAAMNNTFFVAASCLHLGKLVMSQFTFFLPVTRVKEAWRPQYNSTSARDIKCIEKQLKDAASLKI